MGTFKLSFEASEIDEKLKVIEDGGAGYTDENGTIHPIDPKFLPGVCLPVVEITGAPTEMPGMVELTDAESVALNKAAKTGLPCVIDLTFLGGTIVFNLTRSGDTVMYTAVVSGIQMTIQQGDLWILIVTG